MSLRPGARSPRSPDTQAFSVADPHRARRRPLGTWDGDLLREPRVLRAGRRPGPRRRRAGDRRAPRACRSSARCRRARAPPAARAPRPRRDRARRRSRAGAPRPPGVHLHWALPDALLRGDAARPAPRRGGPRADRPTAGGGGLGLAALPDRWLVLRLLAPQDGAGAARRAAGCSTPRTGRSWDLADWTGDPAGPGAGEVPGTPAVPPRGADRRGGRHADLDRRVRRRVRPVRLRTTRSTTWPPTRRSAARCPAGRPAAGRPTSSSAGGRTRARPAGRDPHGGRAWPSGWPSWAGGCSRAAAPSAGPRREGPRRRPSAWGCEREALERRPGIGAIRRPARRSPARRPAFSGIPRAGRRRRAPSPTAGRAVGAEASTLLHGARGRRAGDRRVAAGPRPAAAAGRHARRARRARSTTLVATLAARRARARAGERAGHARAAAGRVPGPAAAPARQPGRRRATSTRRGTPAASRPWTRRAGGDGPRTHRAGRASRRARGRTGDSGVAVAGPGKVTLALRGAEDPRLPRSPRSGRTTVAQAVRSAAPRPPARPAEPGEQVGGAAGAAALGPDRPRARRAGRAAAACATAATAAWSTDGSSACGAPRRSRRSTPGWSAAPTCCPRWAPARSPREALALAREVLLLSPHLAAWLAGRGRRDCPAADGRRGRRADRRRAGAALRRRSGAYTGGRRARGLGRARRRAVGRRRRAGPRRYLRWPSGCAPLAAGRGRAGPGGRSPSWAQPWVPLWLEYELSVGSGGRARRTGRAGRWARSTPSRRCRRPAAPRRDTVTVAARVPLTTGRPRRSAAPSHATWRTRTSATGRGSARSTRRSQDRLAALGRVGRVAGPDRRRRWTAPRRACSGCRPARCVPATPSGVAAASGAGRPAAPGRGGRR